jgi:DNA modification methylase
MGVRGERGAFVELAILAFTTGSEKIDQGYCRAVYDLSRQTGANVAENTLYYGDNLDVLRRHVRDESVDLVYLDPPFNSNATYNVLFAAKDGHQATAQIQAFEDAWQWDQAAAASYDETVERGGSVADVLRAFRTFLGTNDMVAYLAMMAPRLVELRRVMKNNASLYLHCDPTASHYLKLLLDAVFGADKFRSEIVWKRSSAHSDTKQGRKQHGRIHDIILFYTKSDEWTWHPIHTPYDDEYVEQFYKYVEPKTGRRYRLGDITGPGGAAKGNPSYEVMGVTRFWRYSKEKMNELIKQGRIVQTKPGAVPAYKRYLDEMPGVPLQDLWTDLGPIGAQAAERLGYPTQKPVALLERIIESSSNPGETVLDPFCGCGTTIAAAQKLGRRWIGVDVTHLAIGLIKTRLRDSYGESVNYEVVGEPTTVEDAAELAKVAPYQFQAWALGLVGARQSGAIKKGADKGIDGRLYFHDGSDGDRQIVISVKAGKLQAGYVRDLAGVVTQERADIGVLISFDAPTRQMRAWAAGQGFYESPWGKHPRLQLLTVGELLAGKAIEYPRTAGTNVTYKQAPKALKKVAEPKSLFDPDD